MTTTITREAISPLRRRMLEDMSVRKFGEKTQADYIFRDHGGAWRDATPPHTRPESRHRDAPTDG